MQEISICGSNTIDWRVLLEINKSLLINNLREIYMRAAIQKKSDPRFYSVYLTPDGRSVMEINAVCLSWMPESIVVGRVCSAEIDLFNFAFLEPSGELNTRLLKEYEEFAKSNSYEISELDSLQRFDVSEAYKLFQRLKQGSIDFATNCFVDSLRKYPVVNLRMTL